MQRLNRFVDKNLKSVAGRRPVAVSVPTGASQEELEEIVRRLAQRVADLEASTPPPWVEFETQVPGSGTVSFEHGFGCPVRFYVTFWRYNGAAGAPILREASTSTVDRLDLTSGKAGRAVIRIEPSQFSLQLGDS